ncbi:MAG: hypothetical protein ACRCXB_07110 [Aeromonadaceae bacterium]
MIKLERNKSGVLCAWSEEENASKQKSRIEKYEAYDFAAYINHHMPELMMFHVANEGAFSPQHRDSLKRSGVRSGVSDYVVLHRTLEGHTFALVELKRSMKRDSSISKEQADFLLSREKQGGICCVAYGAAAARAVVEWLYKGKPLD